MHSPRQLFSKKVSMQAMCRPRLKMARLFKFHCRSKWIKTKEYMGLPQTQSHKVRLIGTGSFHWTSTLFCLWVWLTKYLVAIVMKRHNLVKSEIKSKRCIITLRSIKITLQSKTSLTSIKMITLETNQLLLAGTQCLMLLKSLMSRLILSRLVVGVELKTYCRKVYLNLRTMC